MHEIAIEPGTEVLDLPDELRLTDGEAESWLDVPGEVMTTDLARLTGYVGDYQWATWLADVLREAGCSVVEYAGWKTRGRPRSAGPFVPEAVIWHHDGSAKGPSPSLARFLAEEGRPAEGIPAPLSQLWVCAGCGGKHPVGTWHVLAAGRANHAGIGAGFGVIAEDCGNSQAIGVETDNTTGEATPRAMYDSLVQGTAAILRHVRTTSAEGLCGHKEYAAGRKIDPDDIDMDDARQDVTEERSRPPRVFPGAEHFTMGHQCKHGHVKLLEDWLLELNPKSKHDPSDTFTSWTAGRVKAFQGKGGSGVVDAPTWRRLQRAARKAR